MKLLKFSVNNFRAITGGLENNSIDFSGSNTIFIFGQNNVGKSTFLNAYEFMFSNKAPVQDDFYKKDVASPMEFELELGVDSTDLEYIKEKQEKKLDSFKAYLNENSIIRIKRIFNGTNAKEKVKINSATDITWDPTKKEWQESSFGSIGLSQVFQALMPTPILIKAMPSEKEVEDVVNEILASKAKSKLSDVDLKELSDAQSKVKQLQEKMYNPKSIDKYKEEVNRHFQQLFPDTKIELEEADKVKWTEDKFGKKFSVEFKKQNADGSLDHETPSTYNSIGHGAVRSAIFSLLLMRDIAEELPRLADRKEYLILFEEPELFLYPKLLKSLRELIYTVSELNYPYQVLCASHSPQMIDLSKRNSTLIRMVKIDQGTKLYQINDNDLKIAKGTTTIDELKHAMYEVLRFNPYICESFYADEVLLVEGTTEEIIIRGILQKMKPAKDLFIVNCGSVTNIPFYQKVYRKFAIRSHVICDTDGEKVVSEDIYGNPVFQAGIQQSIYNEHFVSSSTLPKLGGLLRTHDTNFEVAHDHANVDASLRFSARCFTDSHGKPYNANRYWDEILGPNFEKDTISTAPIVRHVKDIIAFEWN